MGSRVWATVVAMSRADAIERLVSGTFDLLVVGAGIVAARVAFEAARTGARVALLDGDVGGVATPEVPDRVAATLDGRDVLHAVDGHGR